MQKCKHTPIKEVNYNCERNTELNNILKKLKVVFFSFFQYMDIIRFYLCSIPMSFIDISLYCTFFCHGIAAVVAAICSEKCF